MGDRLRLLHLSATARLRAYFIAGVLITAPIVLTGWLAWQIIAFFDAQARALIPPAYFPEAYLPFTLPGIGLVLVIGGLTLIGALTANLVGRLILRISERLVRGMPVVSGIYGAFKQLFETILAQKSSSFREVVAVEFPRPGMWVIGFVSGRTEGEIQTLAEGEVVNVFVPTAPNPTSGYLVFVARREVRTLSMTVEEGMKMVISGGVVTPGSRGPVPVLPASGKAA
ncbi:MAG: DUF502 domain-containing protein [Alphaproteobacteria bacterium]|nr:DUF502 domain-containing protein [Alphaproteobacteria bacterium]